VRCAFGIEPAQVKNTALAHRLRSVIWLTDLFQKNHCQRANKREQPVLDLILQKGLDKQTIF
jgi:hypothetical protein